MRSALRRLVVLAIVAPVRLAAQGPDTAPFILTLPAGTRAQALGHAGVALTDPEAVYVNPAQILGARGVSLAWNGYRSAGNLLTLATAMTVFGGGVGLGTQRLEFFVPTESSATPTGGEAGLTRDDDVLATSTSAALGYARTYRGFRIGVSTMYVEQRMPDERTSAAAANIGIAKSFGGGLWVGFAAQNLGTTFDVGDTAYDFARRYTLGAAFQGYPLWTWFDVGASVALPVYEDGSVLPGGGVELSYVPLDGIVITGRLGARAVRHRAEFPLTSGASIGFDNFILEYAFQSFDYPGYAHRFGVRLVP